MLKDKGLLIGIIATILIIGGGIYLFSRPTTGTPAQSAKVSEEILVPQNAFKSAGFANNQYLPATSSAQVTLVEFGDYECPACAQFSPLVKQLMQESGGKVNFVFRNFPLPQHKKGMISAQAAEAAGLQGKFWEMHEKLYASQLEWANSNDALSYFVGYAQSMGLNVDQFKKDMDSKEIKDKISADINDGNLIRINATPTYYVNGMKLENLPFNYTDFKNQVLKDVK
jgi:protein-disulfide isomerase